MNLSQVVQHISETYNNCEQLWVQVGLHSDEIQQRREAFLQQFLDYCQSFSDQQQAYYDFVNTQVVELTQEVKKLSAQLDLSFDIPGELDQQNKCKQLKQLERLLKSLVDEMQRRIQSRQRLIAEILVKSETCGLEQPTKQIEQIIGCNIKDLENQKLIPSLAQLGSLAKLNEKIDEEAAPKFEQATKFLNQITEKLKTLGRLGLEMYLTTPDFSGRGESDDTINSKVKQDHLSAAQLNILSLALNGQYQPKYNPFFEAFNTCLEEEVANRQNIVSTMLPELRDLEALLTQVIGTVSNILSNNKQVPFELPNAVKSYWEQFSEAGLSYFDPSLLTDLNINVLKRAHQISQQLTNECITFFVLMLIKAKYQFLQNLLPKNDNKYQQLASLTINEIYQISQQPSLSHYYISLNYSTQKKLLNGIMSQINICEAANKQISIINDLLKENDTLKQSQKELEEITADKSRFTSRSREALQKRKREDQIKKQLNTRWPKLLGQLQAQTEALNLRLKDAKISLNDYDILFTKDVQVIKALNGLFLEDQQEDDKINVKMLHDVLGNNFETTINEIVLMKDKIFQNRFKEYYAFAKKEAQRELAKTQHNDHVLHSEVDGHNKTKSKIGASQNSIHNSIKPAKDNYSKYPAVIKTPVKYSAHNSRPNSADINRQYSKSLKGSLTMSQMEAAI